MTPEATGGPLAPKVLENPESDAKAEMRNALITLWISFLVAGVLEMLVFSAVRPGDMHGFGGLLTQMAPIGVYTLAFFAFWAIAAVGITVAIGLAAPSRVGGERR